MAAPGAAPGRRAFVLHGILGSGNNWRTVARRLVALAPDWELVLVDLRNHGRSHPAPPPHTVAACVRDLRDLAGALGAEPELVIGHSFGGKVALAFAEGSAARQCWALDATPEAGPPDGPSEVSAVIAALRAVPLPLERREALVPLLTGAGLSEVLARWMTTNLRPGPGGLVWTFDLDAVEEMLRDYLALDLWPALEDPARGPAVHVVRAGRSDRWTPAILRRFEALPPEARVRLHVLPEAGHWLHVDDPEGLIALLHAHALGG